MLDVEIDDERAIRQLVDTWMDASRRGDIATVLGLMADDVIFMTPGREAFGKEEFRAQSESLKDVEMDGRSDIREIAVHGDWAWIRNHIDLTVTRAGGEAAHRAGYTLTILTKGADGRWRLFRDANLLS
ncbi:MAG TPA: SgcJ/EcaC family oxidoreductase [Sphingomicrobium sp.]